MTGEVMSENGNLDFNSLSDRCLIGAEGSCTETIRQLNALKEELTNMQFLAACNYYILLEHRPDILIYLLKELDKFRDSSSVDAVIRLLMMKEHIEPFDDVDYTQVRVFCARLIANLKDHKSVFALLDCLNNRNENYQVRLSCADALGRLGDKYAVAPLMDIVSDENEKSVYIRESAATALGLIGDSRAVDPLISILETKNGIMDKFTYLKERVIEALSKLTPDNDRAFTALKSSLSDENPQVRITAIEAIMNYEHNESVDLIKGMLKDEDEEVVKNALIALYNLCGEDELKAVIENPEYNQQCKDDAKLILEEEISEV